MASVQDLVLEVISNALHIPVPEIDHEASFIQLGGHSISAVAVASACKSHGLQLSVESILRSDTILQLLGCVVPIPSITDLPTDTPSKITLEHTSRYESDNKAVETKTVLQVEPIAPVYAVTPSRRLDGHRTLMTEMQSSLIHGSQNRPGTNVISLFETYLAKDVPVMRRAWKAVIDSEPIFRTAFEFDDGEGHMIEQNAAPFQWTETVVHDRDTYEAAIGEEPAYMEVGISFKVVTWEQNSQSPALSTIIWRVHHALIDGFSAALVYKKLRRAADGHPNPNSISMGYSNTYLRDHAAFCEETLISIKVFLQSLFWVSRASLQPRLQRLNTVKKLVQLRGKWQYRRARCVLRDT